MNAYAATLDFTSIMDNLSKAGVPDEVITYILSGGSATEDSSDTEASEKLPIMHLIALIQMLQPDVR